MDSLTTVSDPALTKEHYVLDGWYTNSGWYTNGDLGKYSFGGQLTGNLDLYAQWKISPTFAGIVISGQIPNNLNEHDKLSKTVFSNYTVGAKVNALYVKSSGTGDGSSWTNAASDLQTAINSIVDASDSKIYVVLIASGNYKPINSYSMKNHVAIVGGFTADTYSRAGETRLDGNGARRVFNNNGLDKSALLYGLTITNGSIANDGGGMYNWASSPTLINVTFSGNWVGGFGGGMANYYSSPTLSEVTFSGNTANNYGGGMFNDHSSPILSGVTFSNNTATNGGGMHNSRFSFLTLIGVTFSGNTANNYGGGMYNSSSLPVLINTLMWGNNSGIFGGGSRIYYSLIQGATNITNGVITNDPGILSFGDHGGGVKTYSILATSPAKDKGVYVRRSGGTLYYSTNSTAWYSDPQLTTAATPPAGVDDLTATDARGYSRVGRPDIGAYEVGGTAP